MVHNYGVPLKLETRYATNCIPLLYQHSTQEPLVLVESGSSLKGFSCCAAQQLKTFAHSWSFEILSFEADFWRPLKADLEETGRRSLAFTIPSSSTSLFWTTRLWPCVLNPLFLDFIFSAFPTFANICTFQVIRIRVAAVHRSDVEVAKWQFSQKQLVQIWHIWYIWYIYGT